VKEILLFGKVDEDDPLCREVERSAGCTLHQTVRKRDALRFLRDHEAVFMLICGSMGRNADGSLFIQL